MNDIVGSSSNFVQRSRDTKVRYNVETASRGSSGQRLEARVVAEDVGFGFTANNKTDVVVELECFLENGKATEASGSSENDCFGRHY